MGTYIQGVEDTSGEIVVKVPPKPPTEVPRGLEEVASYLHNVSVVAGLWRMAEDWDLRGFLRVGGDTEGGAFRLHHNNRSLDWFLSWLFV